jgi:hypothetical protein
MLSVLLNFEWVKRHGLMWGGVELAGEEEDQQVCYILY